ncbi:hypothetical protein [Haloactinomyces albus]|uniref:Mce-associated membrane protein n=1 Tax=Haloactinomyces albus TaxID=1352928 RepID=A0AAE3ZFT4_9ACTN|nr:hypothetical protein [Haloactinomyces albus]MDR7302452.1 Mce-associated membrane protein [Haloactinomyces albus]
MSTPRRSGSSRGSSQKPSGARRPRVAGLHRRTARNSSAEPPQSSAESSDREQEPSAQEPQEPQEPQESSVQEQSGWDRDPEESTTPVVAEETAPVDDSGGGTWDSPAEPPSEPPAEPPSEPPDETPVTESQEAVAGADAGENHSGADRRLRRPAALVSLMLVLTVAFGGLAVWFHNEAHALRHEGAAANRALVDQAATSRVKGRITTAVEKLFSYDHTNTAKTEKAAKNLLTGKAVQKYDKLFATVRKQAPKQKLVVTTTVQTAGVTRLQEKRAEVLLFVNQRSTRTESGRSTVGPAQLSVVAEKHGDQWKISRITQR